MNLFAAHPRAPRTLVSLLLSLLSWGCAARQTAPADTPTKTPLAPQEVRPTDELRPTAPPGQVRQAHTSARFILRSQNLALTLPDADNWKSLPARGPWSGMINQKTKSELWVRHSAARRTVKVSECSSEARMSLSALRDEATIAHESPLSAPSGYGGTIRVLLQDEGGGRVEAFGVGVSRCLSVVYLTDAQPGFPERLQIAVGDIMHSLEIPSIDARSRREHF